MLHVPYAWCWPQVSLCMQLLKPFGFAEEQLNSVVGTVTFPYYAQSRGVTGKDAFAKSSSGFNPPASESLTLYPIIRLVLMDCLEAFPHDNVLMRAGRSLCYMFDLLDLLVQTMKTHHQVSPQQISDAARVHVQAFKDIHSPQAILPKHHYELHLGVQMRNHNYLGSCFCHERRHKDIKRYATQLAHVSDTFDVTIMKECLAAQFQTWDQEESPCLDGSALKKANACTEADPRGAELGGRCFYLRRCHFEQWSTGCKRGCRPDQLRRCCWAMVECRVWQTLFRIDLKVASCRTQQVQGAGQTMLGWRQWTRRCIHVHTYWWHSDSGASRLLKT